MRAWKAFWVVMCVYSFLLWAYICTQIVYNRYYSGSDFISGIGLSFWMLGIVAFVLSAIGAFMMLRTAGLPQRP